MIQDDFECWLASLDEFLAEFDLSVPDGLRGALDFTPASLVQLETQMLSEYSTPDELIEQHEGALNRASIYVGETFRKALGGTWEIDLENKNNAYYSIPTLRLPSRAVVCPMTLVTASLERRTGHYMKGVFENCQKREKR